MDTTLAAAAARMLDVMPVGEAMSNKQIVNALARDIHYFSSTKNHTATLAHLINTGCIETFTVEEGYITARYYRRID